MLKMTIENEEGESITLSLLKAREVYVEMKELFERPAEITLPPTYDPNVIGPGYNPWQTPYTYDTTDWGKYLRGLENMNTYLNGDFTRDQNTQTSVDSDNKL